jgi:hypothetical protein
MPWPSALTIKILKTVNPCFSAFNNELAAALYEGGGRFDALKPTLLYARQQDANPLYRQSRLQVAEYENHNAGMLDYSRAIAFQAKPRLVFSGAAGKLDYYNTLNDGLQDTLEGRFSDMQLYGYALLTASYPASPLPAAAKNLAQQLVKGGPLDARICYLCPDQIEDWKCDDLGNLDWVKVHTAEETRKDEYGEVAGKLHTWTFITRTEKAVYQKFEEKDKELKDSDTAPLIGDPAKSPLGLPVFEAALVNRNCIMERIKRALVGLFNTEANRDFGLAATCFPQPWYAGPKEPHEFSQKVGENIVLFLGVGGQFGYAVPDNTAYDAYAKRAQEKLDNLNTLINSEFKSTQGKDQHAASGVVKQEEKQPAAVAAESYARKLVAATLEAVNYIIRSRKDENAVTVHFEGMNNFSPLALADKIAAVTQYKLIPGASPTALKIVQRDLDHAMTPGATAEESAEIDEENAEMEAPAPVAPSGDPALQANGAAATSGANGAPGEPTPPGAKSAAKTSAPGILPNTEEKPGDVRVNTKLQKISPADLISQHGVDANFKSELVDSMKATGFDPAHPILVADTKLGYILLDGHHRGNAAGKAGIKSIPANVVSNEDYISLLHAKFGGARPASLSDLDPYIYVGGKPYTEIRDANDHDNKSKAIVATPVVNSAVSTNPRKGGN